MKNFELKITPLDWFLTAVVAVLFSSSMTTLIYGVLNYSWENGLWSGSILGLCLAFFSILLVSINNRYILPRISKPYLWWIISAFFAFSAGFLGFYVAFFLIMKINAPSVPDSIIINRDTIALFSGILNYLMGLLIYLFVRMKTKKEELERLIAEGRILSLNIQLNSHFLHNVINSIAELIRIDINKAEEALIKLSRFLRKVLKERDVIKISEELENVKNYVELENLRYNGLINLTIIDEDRAKNIMIPRFSIQLLVENAIKHGFEGKPLNIKVLFKISQCHCLISVSNDGKKIEKLKFGTGLTNLSKRLKILRKGEIKLLKNNEFIIRLPL